MNSSGITQAIVDAYTSLIYLKVKSELDKRKRLSHYSLFPNPDLKIPVESLRRFILEDMLDDLSDNLTDEQIDKIRGLAEQKLKEI